MTSSCFSGTRINDYILAYYVNDSSRQSFIKQKFTESLESNRHYLIEGIQRWRCGELNCVLQKDVFKFYTWYL